MLEVVVLAHLELGDHVLSVVGDVPDIWTWTYMNISNERHVGASGAGVILPPCAQLLWCRVVCYEEFTKKKNETIMLSYIS